MSDAVIIAICSTIPPTLMAALAWWKAKEAKDVAKDVHKELNSRLTQWKEETATATIASNAASKAEGVKEAEEKSKVPIKGQ
jgi:gas vesicle protein